MMNSYSLRFDLRLLVLLLVVVIAGMVIWWKPWEGTAKNVITVTGEGTVQAAPDQFVFMATYQKKATTAKLAITDVSTVGNEVIAKLKELGVPESGLKNDVTTGPNYSILEPSSTDGGSVSSQPIPPRGTNETIATYMVTATVQDRTLAGRVMDYLATTPVLYAISPQSTFRDETRKKLESDARGKALSDARAKADQTATGLGAKLGKLTTVSDLQQRGGPIPLMGKAVPSSAVEDKTTTPVLETGTQDITYTVTVSYQIK